jgi:hypothetical protein
MNENTIRHPVPENYAIEILGCLWGFVEFREIVGNHGSATPVKQSQG